MRGWADLVAQGWADATAEPVEYANLAIRGKLAWPIVDEQLEPALALDPTHLSFNGGGNDMIRPRTSISQVVAAFDRVIERCDEQGVQLILLSGANPSAQLPMSRMIQRRGTSSRTPSGSASPIVRTSSAPSTGPTANCRPPRTGRRIACT